MQIKKIVEIHNDEPRAGTFAIAKGLDRNHKSLIRTVDRNKEDFRIFGKIESLKSKSTGGRPTQEYLLNEPQATLLITYLRNLKKNDKVIQFKVALVKEFFRMKNFIRKAKLQHNDPQWNQARLTSKTLRLLETGAIQEFIVYAKEQGGTPDGCDKYYSNFTRMMNTLLFICEGKFKSLRDVLTPEQLFTVGSAEQIIGKSLREDMKNNVFYKEIYKNAKKRVELFAELHGQSEVLSKQMLISE